MEQTFENWLIKYSNYTPLHQPDRKRILRYDTQEVFDINDNESFQKCIIEYISGMTDQYAISVYEEIISF
jgi:dGTPase